jgi:hypothetical protein
MIDGFVHKKQKQLDNIKKMYDNTSGEVKEMWRKKWYQLIKVIGSRIGAMEKERRRIGQKLN